MDAKDVLEGRCLLERTPAVLREWLAGLPAAWLDAREGEGTWSPREIVGHLIEGERTDWMPRVRHILRHGDAVAFAPFDRGAHLRAGSAAIEDQIAEFDRLRARSLAELDALRLGAGDLGRTGRHPELGVVTLGQHLATWQAHDLSHLAQIARVLARRHEQAIGPWRAYLPLVGERNRPRAGP